MVKYKLADTIIKKYVYGRRKDNVFSQNLFNLNLFNKLIKSSLSTEM